MSKIIEGKISNQRPSTKYNGEISCSCCKKLINLPIKSHIQFKDEKLITQENSLGITVLNIYSYVGFPELIFESNSGVAVTYCNLKCAKKHNHRFNK